MMDIGDGQGICVRPITQQDVQACGVLLGLCFEEEGFSQALTAVLDEPASRRRFLRDGSISNVGSFATRQCALVADAAPTAASTAAPATPAAPTPPATPAAPAASPAPTAAPTAASTAAPAFDGLPAGIALFDAAGVFSSSDYDAMGKQALDCGCETLNATEAQLVRERARLLDSIDNGSWCARAYPNGYAYIAALCVNPRHRGSGVLSALLDTVIARAQKAKLPLCLDAFSERPRDIYAHKGFELIETVITKELSLTQYRMTRLP
ncbi:MAG: GNAT family N-acetyltransferase [Coriobacteriales bacterium]|jgi:GNAT superfamily N-acetyltransferase|nr:GNAT family N-acetyltransferase [Coriobacteriales bacterium]